MRSGRAHACLGVLARPCAPIEIAQMDMSPQHIRLMEVAEILRRASDERTSSLTSETSRLRSSGTDQDGREIGVRSRSEPSS